MLICPICRNEYQEEYKTCSNCKCDLIEVPDAISMSKLAKKGTLIQFLLGVLIIFCSPILSYQLTSRYFIPNGNGFYDSDQFLWMLNAYQHSLLLIGTLICIPCLIHWIKSKAALS